MVCSTALRILSFLVRLTSRFFTQLLNPSYPPNPSRKVEIPDGSTSIALSVSHAATLKDDDTVWTRGDNAYGQLGDGTTTQRLTPVRLTGLSR